ncbi:MAG: hypothetical protein HYU56_03840 [Candidatus Aenigmarchaeota archaeon]|nr:hypothetical protein [Candidatus Aenigmarchaeota archaeon]
MDLKIFAPILIVLTFSMLVFAQSQPAFPPHTFFGDVLVNGAPATDGTIVSARVDGTEVLSTATVGGVYGKPPAPEFRVRSDDGSFSGRIVRFFVNGVDSGATAIFANGDSDEVDLSVTIAAPPSPGGGGGGGSGSSSSGGGGSGGVAAPKAGTTTQTPTSQSTGPCTERWLCTDWSECQDGFERRTCEDVNKCGTESSKPFESRPCSAAGTSQSQGQESGAPAQQTQPNFLTAFVTANPTAAGAIIVAILGVGFVGWRMYSRRRSKHKIV